MAWLLRRGEVLASVDVARSRRDALRSVSSGAGRGVALVRGARPVPALGSRGRVDLAYLDPELVVLSRPRAGLPPRRAAHVLVAARGSFERWGLRPGDALELKE
ncbi:MAG: DUF192 domain-containing protein [Actinomycetota bacterium]|nr:DUF192 domain-containing protein [Actinomycetota bacterium]